jgi:hypothetical protein
VEVNIQQPYALASPFSVFPLGPRPQHKQQVAPPAVLHFRKWLTIWSDESEKLQDANEKKRYAYAAILEDGLNGAYARKPNSKEKDRLRGNLRKRQKWQAMTQEGAEERKAGAEEAIS